MPPLAPKLILRINPLDALLAIRGLQLRRALRDRSRAEPADRVLALPQLQSVVLLLAACHDLLQALALPNHLQPQANAVHAQSPLARLVTLGEIPPENAADTAQQAAQAAELLLKKAQSDGYANVAVDHRTSSLFATSDRFPDAIRQVLRVVQNALQ